MNKSKKILIEIKNHFAALLYEIEHEKTAILKHQSKLEALITARDIAEKMKDNAIKISNFEDTL